GFGIPVGWLTIGGDPVFFGITKRLHNQIHGAADGTALVSSADAHHYEQVLAANADELLTWVRPGDLAILHDPQTAELTEALTRAGLKVIWRCHIGIDQQNAISRAAWEFLRPYLSAAHAYVFTRRQFAPIWLPRARLGVIPPSIDPFSPKNEQLDAENVKAILTTVEVYADGGSTRRGTFLHSDGTYGEVQRQALITGDGRPEQNDPVVVQVSRWDRLKDMAGGMGGFRHYFLPPKRAYLLFVWPVGCCGGRESGSRVGVRRGLGR